MQTVDPEFIERYQKILNTDPKSQVFALLADAYRKEGKLPQALKIAKDGLYYNSQMASGHLVLGRIYLDMNEAQKSLIPLKEACRLAPDNILAMQYLAEAYLKVKRPKEALSAFKLIMLINPNDTNAATAVKKLESLTADEYDSDLFTMVSPTQRSKDFSSPPQESSQNGSATSSLDRILSLADALAARNDIEKAIDVLEAGQADLGTHPEILKRLKMLANFNDDMVPLKPAPRHVIANNSKNELLNKLLKRIQSRRRDLDR